MDTSNITDNFDLHRYESGPISVNSKSLVCYSTSMTFLNLDYLNLNDEMFTLHEVPCQCHNLHHILNISTSNEEIIIAAHALFDENGHALQCFVSKKIQSNENTDIQQPNVVVVDQQAIIFQCTSDKVNQCNLYRDEWVVCEYSVNVNPFFPYPDGPDERLMGVANQALENYVALDCTLPGNLRRSARILQYYLANKEWEDLMEERSELCKLVLFAMERWEADGFSGMTTLFMRVDARGMIRDLKYWIKKSTV